MADVSEESYVNVSNITQIRGAQRLLERCFFWEDQEANRDLLDEINQRLVALDANLSKEIHVTT